VTYAIIRAMSPSAGESSDAMDQPPSPDEIERQVRQLEAELAKPAKFTEPSAAERARKPRRPGLVGRVWSLVIAVVVVAGLAAAAIELPKLGLHKAPASAAGRSATPASRRTSSSPASFLPTPTVAAPFLGTPAQSYPDGAAGIVIPPAHAVGSYPAAAVTAAYRKTKTLLIAANLNGPTLNGGAPTAFANLLIPQQRSFFLGHLDATAANTKGGTGITRYWVTSFAPGSQLVGNVIKVSGTMQASSAKNGNYNALLISGNYLFVYAVERPDQPGTLMRIVVHYIVQNYFAQYNDPGGALEPWWKAQSAAAGSLCGVTDGYVHPDFTGQPEKVKPSGTPLNPYDQSAPMPKHCQRTTGT
jgi:hypothetical protein